MANEVEIRIEATDLTGPAFASVLAKLALLKAAAKEIASGGVIKFDTAGLGSTLAAIKSRIQAAGIADIADVNVPPGVLTARLQLLKRLIGQSGISDYLAFNVNDAGVIQHLAKLRGMVDNVPVSFDLQAVHGKMPEFPKLGITESIDIHAASLGDLSKQMHFVGAETLADSIIWSSWERAVFSAGNDAKKTTDILGLMNLRMQDSKAPLSDLSYGWGRASGAIKLFGGAFQGLLPNFMVSIGAVHLLIQGAAELAAVLIPAAVGLATFGVGAAPTIHAVVTQMSNMNTVATALDQNLPGISGAAQKFGDAIRPQTLQLFGDALEIVNQRGSAFHNIEVASANALDTLATRFTMAATSGRGLGGLFSQAGPDILKLGTLIGNVGGILGNFFAVLPGYAGKALTFADALTHIAERATSVVKPVLGVGLAAHGALIYIGLATTAATLLARGGLNLVANIAAGAAGKLYDFGFGASKARAALLGFSDAASTAAGLPWGWIAVAAVGVGFLAYKLMSAKDATQQWFAAQEASISGAKSLAQGYGMIQSTLLDTQARLASSTNQLGQVVKNTNIDYTNRKGIIQGLATQTQELSADQKQLNDQAAGFNTNLGKLAVRFGGVGSAMALATLAGVSMNDMMDKSKWPTILSEVMATAMAYREMGIQAGILGSDLNAVNIAASAQVQDMAKVNQGWDTTIGIVSGGQGAFITFAQSLIQLHNAGKVTGATMTGLSANSLQLRGAFATSFANAQTLIDSLRMMQSMSPGGFPPVTRAIQDAIAALIPMASKSAQTRAELVAMAQQANPQITTWHALVKAWGSTKSPLTDLDRQLAKMGYNLQNVAKDAAALSTTMGQQVTSMFAQAKLAANHVSTAISQVAKDMATASPKLHADSVKLYNDLVHAGMGASQAAALVLALTGQIIKIPTSHKTKITADNSQALSAVKAANAALATLHNKSIVISVLQSVTRVVNSISQFGYPVGGMGRASGGTIPIAKMAGGGVTGSGYLTLVGEEGPELMNLPGGTTVHTAADSQRMMTDWGANAGGGWAAEVYYMGSDPLIMEIIKQLRIKIRRGKGGSPTSVQDYLGQLP